MDVAYKNARQEAFAELMQTAENAGFKSANVARWLGVTPGAVSQYRAGSTTPKESVVQLFRRHVEEKITAPRRTATSPSELYAMLLDLERLDPARFDDARTIIETFHSHLDKSLLHAPKPAVANAGSGEERGAVKLLKKAAASLNKRGSGQVS